MKAIVVGILPQDRIRERMLAIARGEYKPKATEPKIWFTSMRSLAEVLSDENRALLKVIQDAKPQSISTLAQMTGRKPGNVGRQLPQHISCGRCDLARDPLSALLVCNAQVVGRL